LREGKDAINKGGQNMRNITIFMLILLMTTAFAEDFVAVNSMDGRDVLSGVYYANALNIPMKFIPPDGDSSIFAAKVGSGHDILLIQSNVPVSSFVENDLKSKNNTLEVYESSDAALTNLDLAKKSGAKRFIIVDSAFSDGAISVIPYAALTDSYVILSNKNNAEDVASILEGAEKVTIYGYVDQAVKNALSVYNPEFIGKGEDKFDDNIEIVEKVMNKFSLTSAIIVDGSFLEESMTLGDKPILLTGRIMPATTYSFLKENVRSGKFTSALLLGNELVVPVYDVREKMESEFEEEGLNKSFGIIVKFAQVLPSEGTGVLVLDQFPMPSYQPAVEISDVFYNTQSKQVMVSIDNIGEGPAYYNLEVRVKVDGSDYKIFGEEETMLIERGEQVPISYGLDMSEISSGEVTALVIVKYGSSKNSLEEFTSSEGLLESIDYVDNSDVLVQSAKYDTEKGNLLVTIRNNGEQTAHVFSKVSLLFGGSLSNVSAADTRTIEPGSLIVEEFPLQLAEADVEANQNVTVFLDYGARPGFLVKQSAFVVDLAKDEGLPLLMIALVTLVVIVLLAAVYLVGSRKAGKKQ
jgi:archaellum component FlaF (FlaF/FlaG flagellin family)